MTTEVLISLIISGVFSVVWYFIKSKVESIEKDVEQIQGEMKEFKENYLERFDKVNKNINESKLAILERLHSIEMHQKK